MGVLVRTPTFNVQVGRRGHEIDQNIKTMTCMETYSQY